jgi:3-hydroxyacyl-CoA dehydrogenase
VKEGAEDFQNISVELTQPCTLQNYLKLFLVTTSQEVDFHTIYGEKFLGKTAVVAKDTPAFIGNRVGILV